MRSDPRTPERLVFNAAFAAASPPEMALRAGRPDPWAKNYMFLRLHVTWLREGGGEGSGGAVALSACGALASLELGTGGSSPARTPARELGLLPQALRQVEPFGTKRWIVLTSVPLGAWLMGRINEPGGGSFLTCSTRGLRSRPFARVARPRDLRRRRAAETMRDKAQTCFLTRRSRTFV